MLKNVLNVMICTTLLCFLLSFVLGGTGHPLGVPFHQMDMSNILLLTATLLFVPVHKKFDITAVGLKGIFFDTGRGLGRTTVGPYFDLVSSFSQRITFSGRCHFLPTRRTSRLFTTLASGPIASSVPRLFGARRPGVVVVILRDFSSRLVRALNKRPNVTIGVSGFTGRKVLFARFCTGDFHASQKLMSVVDNCPTRPAADVVGCAHGARDLPSVPTDLGGTKCSLRCCCKKSTSFAGVHSFLISANVRSVVSRSSFPMSRHLDG